MIAIYADTSRIRLYLELEKVTMKKTIRFNGKTGLIAIVLFIGLSVLRIFTLSEIVDANLKRDLSLRLSSSTDGDFMKSLEEGKRNNDFSNMEQAIDQFKNPITFQSIRASSSLREWSNNQVTIVKVIYAPTGNSKHKEKTEYLRYIKRATGTWEYKGRSSSLSYYMNFL